MIDPAQAARRIAVRVRAITRRSASEAELDEELRYHMDREIERRVAAGASPEAARLAARRAFGNVGVHKEAVRDAWGGRLIEQLGHDVRFALRGFRRSPTFVVTVVATIALALGLNTSVFTLFDAYVLRPLTLRDGGSLYQLFLQSRRGVGRRLTLREYEDLRGISVAPESFAFAPALVRIERRPLFGHAVSGEAMGVLGATPALGRVLLPDDAVPPSGEPVMVLSHDAWESKFGGDSSIIGQALRVHGTPVTVVGVTAKGFTGLGAVPVDFWVPITLLGRLRSDADQFGVNVVVRLRPGVATATATTAFGTWGRHETAAAPDSARLVRSQLVEVATALPLSDDTIALFAPAAVAFALVLLIACANVANVMLARGIARQREIGIRLALGAARARLVRQLLTESVLLVLPAAALGYLLSRWTIDAGVRAMFATIPADYAGYLRMVPLTPDLRVFAFVAVAALAAALFFGLLPALQTTRPEVVHAARGDFDAGPRTGRLRGALVVAQITICALLLIVTGVLIRGADVAKRAATGFGTRSVIDLAIDDSARPAALARLRANPAVRRLAASSQTPLDGIYPAFGFRPMDGRDVTVAAVDFVDSAFFDVMSVPLRHGRAFTAQETRDVSPVAIVSDAAARALWPGHDPVGQVVRIAADLPATSRLARVRTARVVGVAANTVSGWIGTGLDRPLIYFPLSADSGGTRLLLRVEGDPQTAREAIDRDLDAGLPSHVTEIHTLDDHLGVQRWPFRAFSMVSAAIGAIALVLTLIGVYGVLSYLVAQRTREIGIRMALGAGTNAVVALVIRQSLRYAAIGVLAGVVLALGVSRLFGTVLVIVNTFDGVGYALGIAAVLVACIVAAVVPSRRAATVNPVEALRAD